MCVCSTYVRSDSLFNRSPAWLRDRPAFLQNALWLQGKELSIPNKMHMCDWSDSFVNCSRKEIRKENRAWMTIENNPGGGGMYMTSVRHSQRSYVAQWDCYHLGVFRCQLTVFCPYLACFKQTGGGGGIGGSERATFHALNWAALS